MKAIGRALDKPSYTFYGADTLIFVMVDPKGVNGLADGSAAMENMMLAAHSLGLGRCWINQLKYCGHESGVPGKKGGRGKREGLLRSSRENWLGLKYQKNQK